MHDYELYMLGAKAIWVVFVFAFGACAGSLTNVLVYRLPRGLGVVSPPSKCPACETQLTWRENIPVFGWLFLRGRCRFCRSPISAEYPLVEAFVGCLLAATFVLFYLVPDGASVLGIAVGSIKPEWASADFFDAWPRTTWPIFIVFAMLLCSLVAMTLVDAKTFTIPLVLPWTATVAALLFHVGHATILSATGGTLRVAAPGWIWSLPTPGGNNPSSPVAWWWIGASISAVVGLGVGLVLIRFGLIKQSFADYTEWEDQALHERAEEEQDLGQTADHESGLADADGPSASCDDIAIAQATPAESELRPTDPRRAPPRLFGPVTAFVGTIVVGAVLGALLGPAMGVAKWWGLLIGFLLAPIAAGALHRRIDAQQHECAPVSVLVPVPAPLTPEATSAVNAAPSAASSAASSFPPHPTEPGGPDMWIEYPHARREMLRELAFLAPCVLLAIGGGTLASTIFRGVVPPLWLLVLCGVLMGYLIGGGLVWAVRIGGSLAFGKEAMGLGDVHLMAAVGACLGWIDATVAFPLAAVVGLYWAIAGAVSGGGLARAMPFGPYLAAASLAVIYGKPLVEMGLTHLLGIQAGEPMVNLP